MTTEEKNKIIAEYMNVKLGDPFEWRLGATTPLTETHLKLYETSFDWLIPVAKKLKEEIDSHRRYNANGFVNPNEACLISLKILKELSTLKITPLYEAVVDGILFLNKSNQNKNENK